MHRRPLALLLIAIFLLSGCNDFLAQRLVAPPNGRTASNTPSLTTNEILLPVGPPKATLAFWILEPVLPAKGTVLVLHGFITNHHQVERPAKALQSAGYRAVLVDLPGHGKSTADHITYGINDAHDLAQLTTYLQKNNLCGPTIGVFGTSYGAASAILFAGGDPRVTAVVAVAPFATLREEAPYFGKHLLPLPGLFMSPADYLAVVNTMGRLAGFDPDACSPLDAIRKTAAHIRLFHGTWDYIIPSKSSEELAAAAPDRTKLTLFPGQGHLALCLDPFGELRTATLAWFDRYLAAVTPAETAPHSPSPDSPAAPPSAARHTPFPPP